MGSDSIAHEHVKAHTGDHLNEIASLKFVSAYTEGGSLKKLTTDSNRVLPWLWRLLKDWNDPRFPSWNGHDMTVCRAIPLSRHTVD